MLILSRKSGESIVIDGRIKVTIIRLEGETVKVGIEAPAQVPVHRQEVYDEIQRSNQQAITRQKVALPKLVAPKRPPRTAGASGSTDAKPSSLKQANSTSQSVQRLLQ
jgi:carbon storage regulator